MANTYYDSQLTAEEIEAALEAIDGLIVLSNNGKVIAVENGTLVAKSAASFGGGATLVSKSIVANGSYNPADDNADGYDGVTVNVPNSYSAADEGKVVSSGALVAQTSRTVTANGTYDTTENDEVVVNVSGGGSTLVSKTIKANGTYDPADDNADGYSEVVVNVPSSANLQAKTVTQNGVVTPDSGYDGLSQVTVNVSGGGGGNSVLCEVDFTKASFTLDNVVYDSNGATFSTTNGNILVPFARTGMTIELDIASMSLASGTHRRFIMAGTNNGLIYRSTGKWAFYTGSWEDSDITDGDFFDNCTVKVVIDSENKWHIYKDNTLVWEPTAALSPTNNNTTIGATSTSINNAVITGMRVY